MIHTLEAAPVSYMFDAAAEPRLTVPSGSTVAFRTLDARGGALLDREPGAPFDLPLPTPGRGNPLTGPLAVADAEPGDALRVEILDVVVHSPGWCGGHAYANPLSPGRIPRALGRVCPVDGETVWFSPELPLPLRPVVGELGTAPVGPPVSCAPPGRHGGNMDHRIVEAGADVYLPVAVPGALLSIGDVHAVQGDGELSGVALEIGASVTVRVARVAGLTLEWPWVVRPDRIAVLTCAPTFEDARREAVGAMLDAVEQQLRLEPADALALMSVVGDLRIGQAFGGALDITVRVEMPANLGLVPAGTTGTSA